MDASESQYTHPAMMASGGAPGAAALQAHAVGDRADEAGEKPFQPFGEDGLTFADFLDIINPLQHIPVISSIYRHLTGDEIDPASRLAGGTLFGGPIGLVAAVINVGIEQETGQDVGEHVIAMMQDTDADQLDVLPASGPPAEPKDLAGGAGDDLPDVIGGGIGGVISDDMAAADFVTAAGPATSVAAVQTGAAAPANHLASHPVQQHIEVLEWA